MPEMTGNVVCRPILAITLSIIRRAVGYSYNQYSFFCQQLMKSLPHFIKVFQMPFEKRGERTVKILALGHIIDNSLCR